ncbi:MAG: glycosyltransferase [Pseudomonadales bacterium]|nr:glycosyltransferase [Pseudomonadales bacterium]
MKILHLIDSSGVYGAEMMLLDVMQAQQQRGLTVSLLASCNNIHQPAEIAILARARGFTVMDWPMPNKFALSAMFFLLRWINKEGFTLLHSHGYKLTILYALCRCFCRVPAMVVTLHGFTAVKRFSKMALYESLNRLALFRVEAVVCVSDKLHQDLPASLKKSIPCHVIANGIDINRVRGESLADIPAQFQTAITSFEYIICIIARLSYEKAVDRALSALAVLRSTDDTLSVGLLVVGDGPQASVLKAQAVELGLQENIIFTGFQTSAQAFLRVSDFLLIPSRSEGLPMVLLEAMAVAVPVLAANVGAIDEVLLHGQCGDLFEGADDEKGIQLLADNIQLVLKKTHQQQVRNATQRLEYAYSNTVMEQQYFDIYVQLFAEADLAL